jgi:catechol 2,3-dioxygenase-like lactoylglutathione lyase family enzyme
MSVELNHTIVWASDRDASAAFLSEILGIAHCPVVGPFRQLTMANGVSLDFAQTAVVHPQHYAFLVGDKEFDAAMDRLTAWGATYWADPMHNRPGEINHRSGGRGVYFADPDGHNMELLTKA